MFNLLIVCKTAFKFDSLLSFSSVSSKLPEFRNYQELVLNSTDLESLQNVEFVIGLLKSPFSLSLIL